MPDPLGLKAYLAMAKLVALLLLIGVVCYQSSSIHKWHKQADKQAAARAADRATYEAAQAQAEAKNKAHVAAENKLREQISEESHRNFIADRDRLRSQPPAAQGSAGRPGVSGVPQTAGGADGAGQVCVPPGDALSAAENELKLYYLQQWILDQLKVDR